MDGPVGLLAVEEEAKSRPTSLVWIRWITCSARLFTCTHHTTPGPGTVNASGHARLRPHRLDLAAAWDGT
jgi:hypothetical protein